MTHQPHPCDDATVKPVAGQSIPDDGWLDHAHKHRRSRNAEVEAIVAQAMDDAWVDFVADTGNYPDDFTVERKRLEFRAGRWAHMVGQRVAARLAVAPVEPVAWVDRNHLADLQRGNGRSIWAESPGMWGQIDSPPAPSHLVALCLCKKEESSSAKPQERQLTSEPVAVVAATDLHQPVAWIQPDHLAKARQAPFLCRVEPAQRDDFVPLFAAPIAASDLHEQIMNLPVWATTPLPESQAACYRMGHRDARHAAAELVAAIPAVPQGQEARRQRLADAIEGEWQDLHGGVTPAVADRILFQLDHGHLRGVDRAVAAIKWQDAKKEQKA